MGFAYDTFGDGRTVVRGGYGITYQVTINNVTQEQQVSIPFFIRETHAQLERLRSLLDKSVRSLEANRRITLSDQFDPSNLKFPATGAYSFQKFDMRTGYFHQFNLSIQRQIGTTWMTELAYVGNVGRKLTTQRDINAPLLTPGATSAKH